MSDSARPVRPRTLWIAGIGPVMSSTESEPRRKESSTCGSGRQSECRRLLGGYEHDGAGAVERSGTSFPRCVVRARTGWADWD